MGGNAARCVGKYLHDTGIAKGGTLRVETASGIRTLVLSTRDGLVSSVRVDMGKAELRPAEIPVSLDGERVVGRHVTLAGEEFAITCVGMGNPHCVVFRDDVETMDIATLGPAFEHADIFPQRVNAEFVRVLDEHTLRMRVWERGCCETLACGTGACAAVVAAVENARCQRDTDIRVLLPGGELTVRYTDETVWRTGTAHKVFEGTAEI